MTKSLVCPFISFIWALEKTETRYCHPQSQFRNVVRMADFINIKEHKGTGWKCFDFFLTFYCFFFILQVDENTATSMRQLTIFSVIVRLSPAVTGMKWLNNWIFFFSISTEGVICWFWCIFLGETSETLMDFLLIRPEEFFSAYAGLSAWSVTTVLIPTVQGSAEYSGTNLSQSQHATFRKGPF